MRKTAQRICKQNKLQTDSYKGCETYIDGYNGIYSFTFVCYL